MRRVLAISLMLVFGLPMALPLFSAQAAEQDLPVCCRRAGQHHCSMTAGGSRSSVSTVAEKCPCAPSSTAILLHSSFTPATAAAIFAGITRHPAVSPQTEAQLRVSFDRGRQKRGPPALFA